MFQTLVNAFKNKDVRKKILITLGLLLIYRLGCWLPIPGIDSGVYSAIGEGDNTNTMLQLLSSITGGALAQGAFLAIGVSPYINSSIIIQLLTVAFPKLEEWTKQGDEGKRKINMVTRILTLVLAIAQSIGIVYSWSQSEGIASNIFGANLPQIAVASFIVVILIAGSMFTMWLGERITEVGVGNGISLLIFVGILSSAGMAILNMIIAISGGGVSYIGNKPITESSRDAMWQLIGFIALVIIIFTFIIFIDAAERKIPVQYSKQIKGRKQYGGQSTHIPIKINASGVLPIIFANAIITFPQLVMSMFLSTDNSFYTWWMKYLGVGTVVYSVVVGLLIFFFSYFYAQIQFKPDEVSRNIQQYGGFIPGVRPGKPTAEFLGRISKRLTFFGALFLTIIAVVPSAIFAAVLGNASLVNAFSATGMLIVVSVALEFEKQLESLLMMKQYKGFLK